MSIKKTMLLVAGIAVAFAFVAVPAQAQTTDLLAQIDSLLATIAALQSQIAGGTTAGTPALSSFNTNLTIGSTGSDVSALQTYLEANGFLVMPVGVSKGYFGPLTKAAVAAWQSANGISPAVGYFGPISRANLNAMVGTTPVAGGTLPAGCTSTAGFSPTTGQSCGIATPGVPAGTPALAGSFGTINDVDVLGAYSNEEVGDGQNNVKVLGADVEASNDGDIALTAVKVSFDSTGNSGSDNLDDYIESVTLWLGNEEIGSADVDDFSENGNVFSKTIPVSNAVIMADKTAKLYISVDAANNLDSSDISGDSWTVDVDSIRYVDGSGNVTTDTSTGDINAMNVAIDFVSFSNAADTELKISTASDTPVEGIVLADASSDTDDVSLLKGKLKLDGTSDAVLDELPVTFTVTSSGTADGVDDIAGSVTLIIDGQEFSETMSVTAALAGTVTFDNLDLAISAGDTINFEILADINDVDGTVFVTGDTIKATVTASNRALIDIENEEGDQLNDSTEKSGTATGKVQYLRTSGISLDLVSTSTSVAAGTSTSDDQGTFTIKFKVTAVGDTVYVSTLADAQLSGNTDGKTTILVDRSGTATVGGVSVAITNTTDDDLNTAGLYLIEEGDSETFELTTTVQLPTAGSGGLYRAVLGGVRWTTDSTDATPSNSYTSNLDAFKTSYVGLN